VRLEGLGQLKNVMTSLGIEPVTFRLVVSSCLHNILDLIAVTTVEEGRKSSVTIATRTAQSSARVRHLPAGHADRTSIVTA
jgi:hypothetical protein